MLTPPVAAIVLAVIAVLTMVGIVTARGADNKTVNRATSLPAPQAIDSNTGLPMPQPAAQWKDPNWKDPDTVLPEVSLDGLPLEDVAHELRDWFKDAFDVLIPHDFHDWGHPPGSINPPSYLIQMKLKNVTASEVFNAMNLSFEAENTPLRWELTMNGKRPTAVLRVLPALLPPAVERQPPQRMIYFVGELLGDEKSGGMTMEQLVNTISDVYQMSYGTSQGSISSHLQFHKQAQLLIVTGTVDQIRFIEQTVAALKEKAERERKPQARGGGDGLKAVEPKTEATKAP